MQAQPQKFLFVKNLGTGVSTFFNNIDKITVYFFVFECINKSYYVLENTLNIYISSPMI